MPRTALIDVWERHSAAEFDRHGADDALRTVTDEPDPTHAGGTGSPIRALALLAH